eukprot:2550828-Amphidinium_carterae.2
MGYTVDLRIHITVIHPQPKVCVHDSLRKAHETHAGALLMVARETFGRKTARAEWAGARDHDLRRGYV